MRDPKLNEIQRAEGNNKIKDKWCKYINLILIEFPT